MLPTGLEMTHTIGTFCLHRGGSVIALPETGFDYWTREVGADDGEFGFHYRSGLQAVFQISRKPSSKTLAEPPSADSQVG
jgi:hypothetical protein